MFNWFSRRARASDALRSGKAVDPAVAKAVADLLEIADEFDQHGDPALDSGKSRRLARIAEEHLALAERVRDLTAELSRRRKDARHDAERRGGSAGSAEAS